MPVRPLRSLYRPRAVIFDFDGVIAQTEPLHFATFARVLADIDIVLGPEEDESTYLGMTDAHCFQIACERAGRAPTSADITKLVERKSALFRAEAASVELLRGVERVIRDAIERGPTTIASCGRAGDIRAILRHSGLGSYFPRFVSAEDISRSKPDPQCFLTALERLRSRDDISGRPELRASDCLVFEDSVRGVEAARRAGMRCVAITSTHARDELAGADLVIGSFEEWRFEREG